MLRLDSGTGCDGASKQSGASIRGVRKMRRDEGGGETGGEGGEAKPDFKINK